MTIPKEVNYPICKNTMFNLKKENPVLSVNTLSLVIDRKKKVSKTEIFMCEDCNNVQSLMLLSDE